MYCFCLWFIVILCIEYLQQNVFEENPEYNQVTYPCTKHALKILTSNPQAVGPSTFHMLAEAPHPPPNILPPYIIDVCISLTLGWTLLMFQFLVEICAPKHWHS